MIICSAFGVSQGIQCVISDGALLAGIADSALLV